MSVTWGESEGLPKCLIIPLRKQHTATIFFLHGLGDSATGVKPFLQDLTEHPDLEYVRFVLPTAPIMPIIGMNGWSMYSWFDRYSFDHAKRKEDEKGQVQSAKWIDDLIKGRERSRLSQGGAISILTAITSERQLGGLYALSTYVPCRRKVLEIATPQAKNLPILWCHGTADKQVNYDIWKDLAKTPAKQLYTLP
ncbi:Phospholipase/carboxylesterase/thioesterase [Gymnopilus junonius]|uniref:Acyl-protein thioesterase 1 n=1 Tax=Gymnopilus junonius TaxID=109634 RepID=A0A9P5TN00_GYMJU|nr:Phospholipase/carboxylesterase/thioesterase [Gymnopilus junonius]